MTTQTNLIQKASYSYIEQTSVDGNTLVLVEDAVTSGAGNAGGTTVVSATSGSGAAQRGGVMEIISSSTAAIVGKTSYITAYSGGTFSVAPAFPAQVPSGTYFRIYSPTGDPVVVCSSGGTTTTAVDSTRTDSSNQFTGAELVTLAATSIATGVNQTITTSTTTLTVDASLGASTSSGDVFLIRRPLHVIGLNLSGLKRDTVQRQDVQRGTFSKLAALRGGRGGQFELSFELTPLAARAGSGTAATRPPFGRFLQRSMGGESLATGDTVASITSTTITANNNGGFFQGNALSIGNEMRWVTANSDPVYTVNQAYRTAAAANAVIFGTANYYLDESSSSAQGHILHDCYYDNLHYTIFNCMTSGLQFEFRAGQRPMAKATILADHYIINEEDPWVVNGDYTNIQPNVVFASEAYLNGNRVVCNEATIDIGLQVNEIPDIYGANGRIGMVRSGRVGKATLSVQAKDTSLLRLLDAGTTIETMLISGVAGANVGCYFKGTVEEISAVNNVNGVAFHSITLGIDEHGTSGQPDFCISFS